ncbi:MAG: hypothetical protein OEU32_10110 [Acidimicrobiia bacterium]|nr:hypothetical protein [Acidimicrobiia bacterium]
MEIVAALFIEGIEMRQAEGPSTRIDLTGVHFSAVAPGEFPVTISPHLVVLVHCPADGTGFGALEVTFERGGEEIARNVSPVQVEPGRFTRQLVQAQLAFDEPGSILARCRIDGGPVLSVPYTVLDPV